MQPGWIFMWPGGNPPHLDVYMLMMWVEPWRYKYADDVGKALEKVQNSF